MTQQLPSQLEGHNHTLHRTEQCLVLPPAAAGRGQKETLCRSSMPSRCCPNNWTRLSPRSCFVCWRLPTILCTLSLIILWEELAVNQVQPAIKLQGKCQEPTEPYKGPVYTVSEEGERQVFMAPLRSLWWSRASFPRKTWFSTFQGLVNDTSLQPPPALAGAKEGTVAVGWCHLLAELNPHFDE